MNPKAQAAIDFIKNNRWKSSLIAGGSLLFIVSPVVQCPIIFVRAYGLQQQLKNADMLTGFSKLGEALGLRNEALGKSCQKFTWMIPNKEAKETMDNALKPLEFPNFNF
jgi:hypothetical protein